MPRRTYSTSRRKSTRKSAPRKEPSVSLFPWKLKPISRDRKIDIIGGVMIVFGLLVLISMLTGQKGSFTAPIATAFKSIAGIGAFLVPLVIFLIGLWLILRRVQTLPRLSAGRLIGIILLVLNFFTFINVLTIATEAEPYAIRYSGSIGALGRPLTIAFGTAGAVVVMLAWLLIALSLTLNLSIPEMIRRIQERVRREREITSSTRKSQTANKFAAPSVDAELPPDFNPLTIKRKPILTQPPVKPLVRQNEPVKQPITRQQSVGKPGRPALETFAEQHSIDSGWVLPKVEDILDPATEVAIKTGIDQERAKIIEETLASFSAPVKVVDIQRGPTVTQFGVEPEYIETRLGRTRVRVGQITRLSDDLALALAAPRIRIQAPVPGKGYVGIEVPNQQISLVNLRECIQSEAFRKIRSPLKLALGKDVAGKPVAADLTSMPHLLIAGTTGSGKSVCVNSILSCLLLTNSPSEMRLLLVDPKRVELTGYNGIPHLLAPVVVDTEKVITALRWVQGEMEARYKKLFDSNVRNIVEYNKSHSERLPYLVVVIDELADLMMLAPEETERAITRLAQLARATGIHLIIATQRPSVDVVTGLIKANFPARIAFAVASNTDSRVILDQPGAERLLGKGDMLFQAPDAPAPVRLQGTYVSDQEILRLVEAWRLAGMEASPEMKTTSAGKPAMVRQGVPLKQAPLFDDAVLSKDDPMLGKAVEIVRKEKRASISMLQRKMSIGYTRAARMIDAMEERGIIAPPQPSSQMREVLDMGEEEEEKPMKEGK
jgi:S-DNA-T family DNA segregation ATPase FtsK/SpoIIIE